jgi:hypothetical protein
MLRTDEAAQRAVEVIESVARRPGPNRGWVTIDELVYALRFDLSTGTSAIARALATPGVWDSSYVNQLERAYAGESTGVTPNPRVSTQPAVVVLEAEKDAVARGARVIAEIDIATSLVRSQTQGLTAVMLRTDRFLDAIRAAGSDQRPSKALERPHRVAPAERTRDVFVSHAHEDKEIVARPLADALEARGFSVWYDEYELGLGDSLREKIDEGLANARFGVVVLSHSFFSKHWPNAELDGLAAREAGEGSKIILPVWHQLTVEELRAYSPTLAGRLGVSTSAGIPTVADRIADELRRPLAPGSRRLVHSFPRPEAKRERLQPAYATLLRTLVAAQGIADHFRNQMTVEELNEQEAVWDAEVEPLRKASDVAVVDLRLETETDPTVTAFFEAWGEFILWRVDHNNEVHVPKSVPSSEFSRHRTELRTRVDRFSELARSHLASLEEGGRPPVRTHVAPGFFTEPAGGIVRALMISVYNETTRPQRVTGVSLVLSDHLGEIVFTNYRPFAAPPQLVTETDGYTVGLSFDRIREALEEQRSTHPSPGLAVIAVKVRLASGREVVDDTVGIKELRLAEPNDD